ncbi:hypothetical protein [Nonomuraea guangzhouensis]|uniref:Uncharacterized protein n=1 Tax=Nonomuraea guangzhouensis TaxID=1291555 RepID=A0ABW4GUH4_9ACTN|nr:hypothetical protein [Nonomuraea guangzhouensis]
MTGVVLGESLQRVQPGQADRTLVATQLVGGLGEEIGDAAFDGIMFVHCGNPIGVSLSLLVDLFSVGLVAFAEPLTAHGQ